MILRMRSVIGAATLCSRDCKEAALIFDLELNLVKARSLARLESLGLALAGFAQEEVAIARDTLTSAIERVLVNSAS